MSGKADLSKTIDIEGITLSPELIETIKQWQTNEDNLRMDMNTLDDAISHIVSSEPDDLVSAFDLIHRLSLLKGYLKTINPNHDESKRRVAPAGSGV